MRTLLPRALRRAAEEDQVWLRFVQPFSVCSYELGDMWFTGDLSSIDNRAWLAIHLAVVVGNMAGTVRQARVLRPADPVVGPAADDPSW